MALEDNSNTIAYPGLKSKMLRMDLGHRFDERRNIQRVPIFIFKSYHENRLRE